MDSQGEADESNNTYAYFQMWGPLRQSLIEQHRFYIEQGKMKLLSQFENIKQEADEAGKRWLEDHSHRFDPGRHDPATFEEDAYQESIEYYRLLSELRDQTRLSLVAGMFHAWDKQLRDWLLKEVRHWHLGRNVTNKIWSASFEDIEELLNGLGLAKKNSTYLRKLGACRYVVNVYKHGDGTSLDKLKEMHPEYLRDFIPGVDPADIVRLDHTHLAVSDEQLYEFSSAIIEFWQFIPDSVYGNSGETTPKWFDNAIARDIKERS